jgi:hypothetical protein
MATAKFLWVHPPVVKRVVVALVAALAITASSAAAADAAPTGSIAVGSRISTGQLIATFQTSSDLFDPQFGFGLSWFPYATLAAPGEPCVAGSSSVIYVGNVIGPGSQQATEAVDADAGTLCLWVNADVDYLVATAAVPPKPAPAPPAPAQPAPAPPAPVASINTTPLRADAAVFLGSGQVLTVLRRELRRTYGSRFTHGRSYRRACTRLSSRSFLCAVSWTLQRSRYRGTVRIRRNSVTGYDLVRHIRRS